VKPFIRPETPDDLVAIRDLNISAFGRLEAPTLEADIVDALRDKHKLQLSLVAELDGSVVGHVAFSPLLIEAPSGQSWEMIALGPIAVLPTHQRRGIGSALVRTGVQKVKEMGAEAVFLVGDPAYYSRFGFEPAYLRNISYPGMQSAFQVLELIPGSLEGIDGTARYEADFDKPA
jgi:putative acetyltransferase